MSHHQTARRCTLAALYEENESRSWFPGCTTICVRHYHVFLSCFSPDVRISTRLLPSAPPSSPVTSTGESCKRALIRCSRRPSSRRQRLVRSTVRAAALPLCPQLCVMRARKPSVHARCDEVACMRWSHGLVRTHAVCREEGRGKGGRNKRERNRDVADTCPIQGRARRQEPCCYLP